jgi:hypothetical protein
LARKVTPRSEANREEGLDTGVRFTIEGDVFEVRVGDVTAHLAREIRAATGCSFNKLMDEMSTDPDIDTIATFVWIARRIKGETVGIDDVNVDYAAMLGDGFTIDVARPEEVEDSPEA